MPGKVAWGPQRTEGKDSSALVYADGRLYFRFQDGLMVLAEATHEGYRERGSFMIPDVKLQSWTHPVIIDGMMYLREMSGLTMQTKSHCIVANLPSHQNGAQPPLPVWGLMPPAS